MASLRKSFDFAMEFEGGGVTHTVTGDPGGTTKWGLSQRANPDLDIANLTKAQAIEVYRERYWNPRRLGELESQLMADEIFEFAINSDPAFSNRGQAIRAAQLAANDVFIADMDPQRLDVDGQMGPKTVAALNSIGYEGEDSLHVLAWDARFNIYQLIRYRSLRRELTKRFLLGWSRRVVE